MKLQLLNLKLTWGLSGLLMIVLASSLAGEAFAADESLCSATPTTRPVRTDLPDHTFQLCTVFRAVFATLGEALDGGSALNTREASSICSQDRLYPQEVGTPTVLIPSRTRLQVIQRFRCSGF